MMFAADVVPAVARHIEQITAHGADAAATLVIDCFAACLADGTIEGYLRHRSIPRDGRPSHPPVTTVISHADIRMPDLLELLTRRMNGEQSDLEAVRSIDHVIRTRSM